MNDIGTSKMGTSTEPGTVRLERLLPGPIERAWAYLTESDKRENAHDNDIQKKIVHRSSSINAALRGRWACRSGNRSDEFRFRLGDLSLCSLERRNECRAGGVAAGSHVGNRGFYGGLQLGVCCSKLNDFVRYVLI